MGAVLKYWDGSVWAAKPLKYWDGSAWKTKALRYWNGTNWIGGPPYQDNFNRANANLEASLAASGGWNWTHDGIIAGGFIIQTNQIRCNTALTTGSAYKTPVLANANHYVQYKIPSISGATGSFACCRLADASNFVGVRTGTGGTGAGQIEVYRRVANTLSSLYASPINTVVNGDIIRLECSGTTFTVKKNGVPVSGATAVAIGDASLTSVGTGLLARSSVNNTYDDFEAGIL